MLGIFSLKSGKVHIINSLGEAEIARLVCCLQFTVQHELEALKDGP